MPTRVHTIHKRECALADRRGTAEQHAGTGRQRYGRVRYIDDGDDEPDGQPNDEHARVRAPHQTFAL